MPINTDNRADLLHRAPLSEPEIAQLAVRYANSGDPRAAELLLNGHTENRFWKDAKRGRGKPIPGGRPLEPHPEFAALRERLRADLESVLTFRALRESRLADGGERPDKYGRTVDDYRDFFRRLQADAARVALYPLAAMALTERNNSSSTGARLKIAFRLVPESLRAALSYALLLISDDERGCTDLRQCRLEGCDAYFFPSATGLRFYCCAAHRVEATKEKNRISGSYPEKLKRKSKRADSARRAKK